MPIRVVFSKVGEAGDWFESRMVQVPRLLECLLIHGVVFQVKVVTWIWNGDQGLFDQVSVEVIRL